MDVEETLNIGSLGLWIFLKGLLHVAANSRCEDT